MNQTSLDGKNPALEPWCMGWGSVPAEFMFIGISAGRLGAIKTQVPFTKGPSGRLFQRCLSKLSLSMSDEFSVRPELLNCYVTNFVKGVCLTEKRLNRLPTTDEFTYWWSTLRAEILRVQPRLLICLSQIVYDQLIINFVHDKQFGAAEIIQLKHPRWYQSHGALTNESTFEKMVKDYSEALGVMNMPAIDSLSGTKKE